MKKPYAFKPGDKAAVVSRSGRMLGEPAFVRLTGSDGIYGNPDDLENLDGITGTAIFCGDVFADVNSGRE